MVAKRKKKTNRTISLEISRSEIDLVVIDHGRDGKAPQVHTRNLVWREESTSLHSDIGQRELTSALKRLSVEEKLSGASIQVALNGEFCVTRVVAGSADQIRRELRQLEDRSSLYLSLGAGEKRLAAQVRQIDVRHQHAWLTVTNRKTLDAVLSAAQNASLVVELMEPSLVALCRTVGKLQGDAEAPALILAVNERSVDLGITYQGRLLLDYRPGGRRAKEEIATIVHRHLERLQRYCDRHFRHTTGKISQVFLCGETTEVEAIRSELERLDQLESSVLDPRAVETSWEFEEQEIDSRVVAAFGTAMAALAPATDRNGPNLADRSRAGLREPIVRGLLKATWPIAATILLTLGLATAVYHKQDQCTQLQSRVDSLASSKQRFEQVKVEFGTTAQKLKHFKSISDQLAHPEWKPLLSLLGHCMPDDVWLDKLSVDKGGRLSLSGSSYSEKGITDFERWLREAPQLAEVDFEGAVDVHTRGGLSMRFDITCSLARLDEFNGEVNKND